MTIHFPFSKFKKQPIFPLQTHHFPHPHFPHSRRFSTHSRRFWGCSRHFSKTPFSPLYFWYQKFFENNTAQTDEQGERSASKKTWLSKQMVQPTERNPAVNEQKVSPNEQNPAVNEQKVPPNEQKRGVNEQ